MLASSRTSLVQWFLLVEGLCEHSAPRRAKAAWSLRPAAAGSAGVGGRVGGLLKERSLNQD